MTDADFHREIDADPAARLIYADWLEDQGEIVRANGQRWQHKHGKAPVRATDMMSYYWKQYGDDDSTIPLALFVALQQIDGWRLYPTLVAAETALAVALAGTEWSEFPN